MSRKRLTASIIMILSSALFTVGTVLVLTGLADVQALITAQNESMGLLVGPVTSVALILFVIAVDLMTVYRLFT